MCSSAIEDEVEVDGPMARALYGLVRLAVAILLAPAALAVLLFTGVGLAVIAVARLAPKPAPRPALATR